MVVTDSPSTIDTGVMQERMGLPSTCTVQAPHAATPQPNLVPVSLRCSRSTHRSGTSPSTLTSFRCPLTVNATIGQSSLVHPPPLTGLYRSITQHYCIFAGGSRLIAHAHHRCPAVLSR